MRKKEEEEIQLARYQRIEEQLFDRDNNLRYPSNNSYYSPYNTNNNNTNNNNNDIDIDINNNDNNNKSSTFSLRNIILFLCGILLLLSFTSFQSLTTDISPPPPSNNTPERLNKEFDEQGRFILQNFDMQKPMSSFLPGLGGIWGVPMWAFYINRGQGITAFGVDNKDGAIAKYNSAEKAYQQTAFTGFRTFLKGNIGGIKWEHMPFFPRTSNECTSKREMSIGMNELEINEYDDIKQLGTNILYFTVPEEEFPALVRRVKITNFNQKETLSLEILDGLTKLEPSGIPNGNLDSMGRTMEAWMNVYNIKDNDSSQPFFHISQGTADAAEVQIVKFGHFSIGYLEGIYYSNGTKAPIPTDTFNDDIENNNNINNNNNNNNQYDLLPFIVDPSIVFDTDTTLVYPHGFFSSSYPTINDGHGIDELFHLPQGTTSRTPCAYTGASLMIPPGGYMILTSIYGHSNNIEEFLNVHSPKLRQKGYVENKLQRARDLVEEITSRVQTNTSSTILNKYIQQNFLDNVLRGGLPLKLGEIDETILPNEQLKRLSLPPKSKIYHVYSRIHGDLERDYNFFNIDTTYFSQGPGNFRDVNQNRRIDVIHSPFVEDYNIRMFLSFIQADGYNPLTVASPLFIMSTESYNIIFPYLGINDDKFTDFMSIVTKSYRIGQLLKDMKLKNIISNLDRDKFINLIISVSRQSYAGQYAQNGFWTDHWTYTLDLIKSYLTIFPDREEEMMYNKNNDGGIPFYMSPAIVKPRSQRYVLVKNNNNGNNGNNNNNGLQSVRVYNAVVAWGEKLFPKIRENAMMKIFQDPSYVIGPDGSAGVWQRCKSGQVFTVTPITKLSMLAILKFSTLDPLGMGVEMEGGKPGWNDAMNGLPGIIGSEMSETYEMLQIVRYLKNLINKYPDNTIVFPTEFYRFMVSLDESLNIYDNEIESTKWSEDVEFRHWDRSNNAREIYRSSVIAEVTCHTHTFTSKALLEFLTRIEKKTSNGIDRALSINNNEISPTYFYYDCIDYDTTSFFNNVTQLQDIIVTPKKFKVDTLPLFLEGAVRHMKTISSVEQLNSIYQNVKSSELYDQNLQMFKISGSLKQMGQEIGRMVAFSPGWLENESIWLHMSYKFYLELLRGKLYDAFYLEISTGVVAFMDSLKFGRSPLEAASFIVSSAFPDKKLHGAGFLARLSGSTAEFLSMWIILFQGHQPFYLNESNEIQLKLSPILARWLFYSDGTISFKFLGEIDVVYHNTLQLDTWNLKPYSYHIQKKNKEIVIIDNDSISTEYAQIIRNLEVERIDVYLG